jgi:D-arabinonate dehydratase
MKITDVRIRTIRSKVLRPFTNSLGTSLIETTQTTILEVFTDAGITGVLGSNMMDDVCKQIILNQLKPLILGEDPKNYERVWRKMFGAEAKWRPPIAKGEVVRAISALDTAMWDIIGKELHTPVYKLLGGYRDEVPCYASGGHYVSLTSHSENLKYLESEMAQYMEMGFKAVKMRVGRDIAKDSERVKLVREVIGPDVKLMIDFNSSPSHYGGVPYALKFMRALEKYDPFWFEDPLVLDDRAGLKQLSDTIDTAVATGEYEQSLWGFRDLIVNKIVDILLPDATAFCGGISQWRKIAAMAEAFQVPVAAHIGDMAHIHCVAGVPNGLIVEVFMPLDKGRRMYEVNPLIFPNEDGLLEVPEKAGLGIELNEEYIKRQLKE